MCAMANVHFTGSAVLAQRDLLSFVVRPSFCAALLGMSSFRIWHISSIFKVTNIVFSSAGPGAAGSFSFRGQVLELLETFPQRVGMLAFFVVEFF